MPKYEVTMDNGKTYLINTTGTAPFPVPYGLSSTNNSPANQPQNQWLYNPPDYGKIWENPDKAQALHDTLMAQLSGPTGLTPPIVSGLSAIPKVLAAVAGGTVAGTASHAIAKNLGAGEGVSNLVGDAGTLAGGMGAGTAAGKIGEFIAPKISEFASNPVVQKVAKSLLFAKTGPVGRAALTVANSMLPEDMWSNFGSRPAAPTGPDFANLNQEQINRKIISDGMQRDLRNLSTQPQAAPALVAAPAPSLDQFRNARTLDLFDKLSGLPDEMKDKMTVDDKQEYLRQLIKSKMKP